MNLSVLLCLVITAKRKSKHKKITVPPALRIYIAIQNYTLWGLQMFEIICFYCIFNLNLQFRAEETTQVRKTERTVEN
jgi:hypothetical protein